MFDTGIEEIIDIAIKEDIGEGDHTTNACVPNSETGKAQLLIKQNGIIAGVDLASKIFSRFDKRLSTEIKIKDGTKVFPGDIAFFVEGPVSSILQMERLVLNFMQRMSGIATETNKYVEKIKGTNAVILDTRKTTPGLRLFEKYAVHLGGAANHRIGLYDMILIKDNHIKFSGGVKNSIIRVKDYLKKNNKNLKIEIEARTFEELNEIMETGGIDRILIDNFSPKDTEKIVKIINHNYETEASGQVNIDNVRDYALTGVDFISIGALTHQIKSLDLSLKATI